MKTKKVKPCRCGFCHSKPEVIHAGKAGWYVGCFYCDFFQIQTKLFDDKENAIAIWNESWEKQKESKRDRI